MPLVGSPDCHRPQFREPPPLSLKTQTPSDQRTPTRNKTQSQYHSQNEKSFINFDKDSHQNSRPRPVERVAHQKVRNCHEDEHEGAYDLYESAF